MNANNGVHTPDDDEYYYCTRNECPCKDGSDIHKDLDSFFAALDSMTGACGHECCEVGACDCAYCDPTCGICPPENK